MLHESWYTPWLTAHERVLWQGKPEPDASLAGSELSKGAPMLLMLGWGGFMLYKVLADGHVPPGILIGICVFVGVWLGIAFWMGFGRTMLALRRLRDTEYVITNRRVLRRTGNTVDALDSRSMETPRLRQEADGKGTIRFSKDNGDLDARHARHPSLALADAFALMSIPDADRVLHILAGMDKTVEPVHPLTDRPIIPIEEDEQLLWQGHPAVKGLGFTFSMHVNSDKWVGGLWAAMIGLAAVVMLAWARAPLEVWLVCSPFAAALVYGLYCLGLFSLRIQRQMNDEDYVITNRRVLRRIRDKITAYVPGADDVIFLCRGREGCGTVVIGDLREARRKVDANPRRRSMTDFPGFQLRSISDPLTAMDALHTLLPEPTP